MRAATAALLQELGPAELATVPKVADDLARAIRAIRAIAPREVQWPS
ncbi:hypothetical protein [Nonomuraea sp. NPDC050786]